MRAQLDKLLLAISNDSFAIKGREIRHSLATVQDERAKYDAAIPMAMVLEERKEPRETFVLHRGRYDQPDKAQKVQPDVPAVLPPLAGRRAAKSPGPCAMARQPGESAYGAGYCQSAVAASLRRRIGEDVRQPGRAIRAAVAPGVARLAGHGVGSIGLGFAAHSAADREQQHVPTALRGRARNVPARPRQSIAGARAPLSTSIRSDSRQRARGKWLACG